MFIGSLAQDRGLSVFPPTPSQFNSTIREVVHRDYMQEIDKLRHQLEQLEKSLQEKEAVNNIAKHYISEAPPVMAELEDDDCVRTKVAEMIRQFNHANKHLSDRLDQLGAELVRFITGKGVGHLYQLTSHRSFLSQPYHPPFALLPTYQ